MASRYPTYLLFVCLITMGLSLSAQTPVKVGKGFKEELLSRQAELLEDAPKNLTIQAVLAQKPLFKPNTQPFINPGFTNSYYWLRFKLTNPDSVAQALILEVENPHINKLQLFTVSGKQVHASMLTGDHFPFAQRPIRHPHFLFPVSVPPGETLTYYLWVDKHGEQLQIPLRLWEKEYFSTGSYAVFLFLGFLLGIASLYCIVSFFVFIFFRQRLTFYYWIYTTAIWLFLVAHTGLGFQLLWSESTWWASAARPTTAMLLYSFMLLFTSKFFNVANTQRFIYLFIRFQLGAFIILFLWLWSQNPVLGLFKQYWYNPVYYEGTWLLVFMKLTNLVVFILLATTPFIGVYYYFRYRKLESLWFTLGNSMLLFGGMTVILVFAGYLPENYITQNMPLMTNALESVILSFLLANRFKNIYQLNAQISAELAEQRQQNAIQLFEGQMIERKRLSQELHDGISLSLANIRLRLSMLAEKLNGHSKEANHLVEALGDVGQDVRRFSHALSPVMLERYGLVEALEELVHHVQTAQPEIMLTFETQQIEDKQIPSLVSQMLYQIALELLNNIVRHAQAHHATLRLIEDKETLTLEVLDDGIGYENEEISGGIGLQNIRARVQLLNGSFYVTKQPKGMKHTVTL
ncbi:sensor histidine kinase [Runella sp.]|uniref:sensor histidine kinase n=1 Tax=Runella sp. TaxID=1960881 RepID=UPI003D0AD410